MEPSCRMGESMHAARIRVLKSAFTDPLIWVCLFCVIYTGIQALNTGIGMKYDPEAAVWTLRSQRLDFLPGSVEGTGFLPFASTVVFSVICIGVGHALGKAARSTFLAISASLAGIAAISSMLALCGSNAEAVRSLMARDYSNPSFIGVAYGIWFLASLTIHFDVIERRWFKLEPLILIALTGNLVGLYYFTPLAEIAVFIVGALFLWLVSFALSWRAIHSGGALKSFLFTIIAFCVVAGFAMNADANSPIAAKNEAILALQPFPDGFLLSRKTLTALALKIWKTSFWLGTGLGSFALDMRFNATPADWAVIVPWQTAVPNGWCNLILERGVVGAFLPLMIVLALFFTWFKRLVITRGRFDWRPYHIFVFVVMAILIAVTFVDISIFRPDTEIAMISVLVMASASMPRRVEKSE